MSRLQALINCISVRNFSLSSSLQGKRNFRKFTLLNKRGTRLHKERQAGRNPELKVDKRGVRDIGFFLNGRYHIVPEMIPELVVPDLTDCKLKPYVSYRTADVVQSEFTAEQLFDAIYSKKIVTDYKEGKLDENGLPLNPSEEENLQPDEAIKKARKTGSDIF